MMFDEEKALAQADRASREREMELEEFRNTYSTPAGRRVFWRMLVRCHFLGPVFRSNSTIYQTATERDLGLEYISQLAEADPGLLADILTMGLRQRKADMEEAP